MLIPRESSTILQSVWRKIRLMLTSCRSHAGYPTVSHVQLLRRIETYSSMPVNRKIVLRLCYALTFATRMSQLVNLMSKSRRRCRVKTQIRMGPAEVSTKA